MIDTSVVADLIAAYAHAMDTKQFDLAASVLADPVEIDYSAVGGPKASMTPTEVKSFLSGLLGRDDLHVHTMIGQVIPATDDSGTVVAYYAVRHFRGVGADQKQFSLVGWYKIAVDGARISKLVIAVQATEGDPAILG